MVPLEQCLAAAKDCDAPMVSICGGEPLIYPKIEELVAGLREQGRIIYICTNGVFMRKKMREYLAAIYDKSNPTHESYLSQLLAENLITEKEADAIRNADATAKTKTVIHPSKWHYWNVHVDGLEFTHDLIVEREGVFKECVVERPRGRAGVHARPHCRARRRLQGMRRRHQDGQDSGLPNRDEHDCL